MIELAAVADPAAVPEAVAAVLGINQQPGLSLADSIAAALESRSRLLIFDNCEHVLDAAADMIDAILAHSPTGEDTRDKTRRTAGARRKTLARPVSRCALERARSCSSSGFAVSPAVSIVRGRRHRQRDLPPPRRDTTRDRAGRSRLLSMTVTELRDHLDDRFRLLVGSRRGFERHQTLRDAVQWSYDLLDADEQTLLNRCSVFAGGFDVDGARQWRTRVTSSSPWIYSRRWYASPCWSLTKRRAGHDSPCWRPSANSPKSNSWLRAMPRETRTAHAAILRGPRN